MPSDPLATGIIGARGSGARLFALKHGDTFAVADSFGDILGDGDGLFLDDTRILSRFRLTIGGQLPSLLGAAVGEDTVVFTANLANRPLPPLGGVSTPEGVIHVERSRLLWERRLHERLVLTNFAELRAVIPLSLSFAADFRDMFEVRGTARPTRGRSLPPELAGGSILFRYEGLDGVVRGCAIAFSEPPAALTPDRAEFTIDLGPGERREIYLEVGPVLAPPPGRERHRTATARARLRARAVGRRGAGIRTPNRLFDGWIARSRADLALLTTELPTGPYPYAGIPWFSTPFGRDAIVTAMQLLWLDPSLARGVLAFLALHQAREVSPFQDAAPGKIMHEMRRGEMSALREIPFGQYYGGVDTTPLFVMLAGAYAERSGDMALIDTLWPALRAAMGWIEGAGDSNQDGFVDYARGAATGLANQGWKDSHDSIFHADGSEAVGPIALVEVQGFVYAAQRAMADLAARRGETAEAARWQARAEALRAAVEEKFWIEELGFYAIALDGAGRPCRVRASNAGQLLFSGLPDPARAARVAAQLLTPAFNSGWAVRTLALGERRFNPMSYHNGSVWPHDTALCAAGLARYGAGDGALRLADGLFDAAVRFDMQLPELFCGFARAPGEAPIAYPVACLPQAWAAGSALMALQACLGIRIDGWRGEIHVESPRLPAGVDRLAIHRLQVAGAEVDLTFQRLGDRVVAFSESRGDRAVPVLSHV
ncbi:MAG TPA: amylo-alpha-1,6-glucosidase [Roseomonas sp.]|jgi:glycogen debranching enzyme